MPKKLFPLAKVYGLLEPGPVLLLTTAGKKHPDIMTMSWHTMLDFEPPLVACVVSNRNYSYRRLTATKECVLNIPTLEIADKVVLCGNSSGARTDKFAKFSLTPTPAKKVGAPLIDECYSNLECKLVDASMAEKYCLFVLEVVKAWIDPQVKTPRTLHHLGYGRFMVAGDVITLKSRMR